ncbi:MAG: hypothetical protein IJ565_05750 [Bacilli bacterium]|nr:hypothetical protein [Bacilli bacterium]
MINLIKEYINKLDKGSVNTYLNNQGIHLNSNELDIIYNHLKNNWYTFLYEDDTPILNDIKEKLDNDNYLKLLNLYKKAKEKYSFYL